MTAPPQGAVLTEHQQEIAELQRTRGRSGLDEAERDLLAMLHDGVLGEDEEDTVTRLLTRPFSRRLTIPEYYQYTCLHAYGWFLGQYPEDPVGGALLTVHATLADLAALERDRWTDADRPDYCVERIKGLDEVLASLREIPVDQIAHINVGDLVDRAEADPVLRHRLALLVEATRFPRSDRHEEHIFLRSVQACEVLFFLIRRLAVEVTATRQEFPGRAAGRLAQAEDCARLLNEIFEVLRTLSPDLFMSFRDATGAASAVQSLNFHAMDIAVYGYDPRKFEVFESIGHLAVLNDSDVQDHHSLSAALAQTSDAALEQGWKRLDRALAKWRGGHYRFARTYLDSGTKGSGDTEGAAYVKKFMKKDVCLVGTNPFGGLPLLSGFLFC
ncbi:hypothetical protein ACFCYH_26350 [Streptomyces sp. NPDC056400]|uniref:hypothetical protein n=1 Tax=unclassified Streptomyces TaxID=2593676 RepID=UPI0035D5CA98